MWTRPDFRPSGRRARIELVAVLDGARVEDALERARAEAGGAAFDALDVDVCARATDGGRLAELLAGRAGMTLAARDEAERHDVERSQWYARVTADVPDAAALEGDLVLAVCAATARWWTPDELRALAPDRAFSLDEHVQLVVEAVERRPGAGHVVRSRGLGKLARPDVGARVPRRDAERVCELLRDVARLAADGAVLAPGDTLRAGELGPFTFVPRTDDALADAPAADAPLYELRDLDPSGPAATCDRLLTALRPKPRLKVLK